MKFLNVPESRHFRVLKTSPSSAIVYKQTGHVRWNREVCGCAREHGFLMGLKLYFFEVSHFFSKIWTLLTTSRCYSHHSDESNARRYGCRRNCDQLWQVSVSHGWSFFNKMFIKKWSKFHTFIDRYIMYKVVFLNPKSMWNVHLCHADYRCFLQIHQSRIDQNTLMISPQIFIEILII